MSPTYELIDSITLSSNQSSVLFSNISQNYDDLKIVVSGRSTSTSETDGQSVLYCRFNGTDYSISRRHLYSTGASIASGATSNINRFLVTGLVNSNASYTANTFSSGEINIPNYTSSQNKSISATVMLESNLASTVYMERSAGLVPLTNPISSLEFYPSSGSLASGSTFELYGIKNADDGSEGYFGPAARGGDEVYTTGDGYKVHVFKTSGTLEVTSPGEVECLVVAGGGGGNSICGGGGGAGGYRNEFTRLEVGNSVVTVGAGGPGVHASVASSGNNSSIVGIISNGGGGGAYESYAAAIGGSGGGGQGINSSNYLGASGISGQGNAGGNGSQGVPSRGAGGGGGAGAVGSNASGNIAGSGGAGISNIINGSSTYYAGGGGGGSQSGTAGSGGIGGGASGTINNDRPTDATANTGGGGGGRGNISGVSSSNTGSNGGSGIVIIRYKV